MPAPFDDFIGLHTGMTAGAACATMIERDFVLMDHRRVNVAFGEPQRDLGYVDEMIFEGKWRPLGVETSHTAKVTLSLGAPVMGNRVEKMHVSYFFANQETPEPENKDIYDAFVAAYGSPTSPPESLHGSPEAVWMVTSEGVSDPPLATICVASVLDYAGTGRILEPQADESCPSFLRIFFGGNHTPGETTARNLNYIVQDNVLMRNSRIVERTVSQGYRTRAF